MIGWLVAINIYASGLWLAAAIAAGDAKHRAWKLHELAVLLVWPLVPVVLAITTLINRGRR